MLRFFSRRKPAVKEPDTREPDDEDPAALLMPMQPAAAVPSIEIVDNCIHIRNPDGEMVPLLSEGHLSVEISEEAKCRIARKICQLVPSLTDSKKDELLRYIFHVLRSLTEEQLSRVKQVIAEELKDSPYASHELITTLAWDRELTVCSPVLECSPVLTDDDLIAIIRESHIPGAVEAIAGRSALSTSVTEAVARSGVVTAVTRLLGNRGADFSATALDVIIEQAPLHESWHEPLLGRPELTLGMVNKVAAFVSEALIDTLHASQRIDDKIYQTLRKVVPARFNNMALDRQRSGDIRARDLYIAGALTPEHVELALEDGDKEFVIHAIACLTGFLPEAVRRMFGANNAKVITALAWKAGLSMRMALEMQRRMARIHHTQMVYAKGGTDFPLEPAEMELFLDVFER